MDETGGLVNDAASGGFKRELPDNCVEYLLFALDGQADAQTQLHELEAIRKAAMHQSQTLTKDYIWQRDEFSLELKTEDGSWIP